MDQTTSPLDLLSLEIRVHFHPIRSLWELHAMENPGSALRKWHKHAKESGTQVRGHGVTNTPQIGDKIVIYMPHENS